MLFLAVLAAGWIEAPAQVPMLERWDGPVRILRTEFGPMLVNIWNIALDDCGYLWLAAGNDLVRFDGLTFTTVPADDQGTPIEVLDVAKGVDGVLWVASSRGVWQVVDGVPRLCAKSEGWLEGTSAFAVAAGPGSVWAATPNGLCEYSSGRWRQHPRVITTRTGPLPTLAVLGDGSVWMRHWQGLLCLRDGQYRTYTTADGLPSNNITCAVPARRGGLWVGTSEGFGRFLPGTGFTPVNNADGSPLREIYGAHEEDDGSLVITGIGILSRRTPDGSLSSLAAAGVRHLRGLSVLSGKDGQYWVATWGNALWSVGSDFTKALTETDGLSRRRVFCVMEDRREGVWIGMDDARLMRWDGWSLVSMDQGLEGFGEQVGALMEMADGTVWASGTGWLKRFSGGGARVLPATDESGQPLTVNALCEFKPGQLVAGTSQGVYILDGDRLRRWPGEPGQRVLAMHHARDGALWVSNLAGLFVFRNGIWESVPEILPRVLAFHEEQDGSIWLSRLAGELVRWRRGRYDRVDLGRLLARRQVVSMVCDRQGFLWMGTRQGFQRAAMADLNAVADRLQGSFACTVLSTHDGLVGTECLGYRQPHAIRRKNGDLLFCSSDGLVIIRPDRFRPSTVPPTVVLESLSAGDRKIVRPKGQVSPDGRDMRIRYAGVSLRQGPQVVTRYRLEGYEKAWHTAGQTHIAEYTNLPPGRYTFQVQASAADADWSRAGASLQIRIPGRPWERGWFWGAAFAIAALAVWAVIHARLRLERIHADKLNRLVDERTLELRRSEERFRMLVERAPCAIFLLDTGDGKVPWKIIDCNPAAHNSRGYTRDEVVGRSFASLYAEPPSPEDLSEMRRKLETRGSLQGEVLHRRKDGQDLWVSYICVLIEVAGAGRILVFDQDITEHKQRETERERAIRIDSLGVLAGGIAHDFNNLLTVILANVSMARSKRTGKTSPEDLLAAAEQGCQRAHQLANQLLTFARGGQPVRRPASLSSLLQQVCSFSLRGSNCQLDLRMDPDLLPVEIDEGQIGQVFQNLLINAMQAMPGGGTIRVVARNVDGGRGHAVNVSVRDQGPGIKPEVMGRLFEPYFSTKIKGSGLGLATSYSIVRAHGGDMKVESEVDHGAEFIVILPAMDGGGAGPAQTVQSQTAEPRLSLATSDTSRGSGRVLVMDDDPNVRRVVVHALESAGYDILEGASGEEALRVWRDAMAAGHKTDLGLFDLTVPGGMGGSALLAELRRSGAAFPVLLMSGYSTSNELADPKKHGFVAALNKPFTIARLQVTVAAAMKGEAV